MSSPSVLQQKAINLPIHNTLVSAGAGSGKTFVLKFRILNHLKHNISLDNLLIVTFTNLAADQMRQKIREVIKDEIKVNNNPFLKEQLDKVESAKIMTFDAYCSYIVRKYAYKLNINPNFNIVEDNSIENLKEGIFNELLEEEYKNNSDFINRYFSNTYFPSKDDSNLIDVIKNLYNEFDKCINPIQELNKQHKIVNDKEALKEKYIKNRDEVLNALDLVKEKANAYYDKCMEALAYAQANNKSENWCNVEKATTFKDSINEICSIVDKDERLNRLIEVSSEGAKGPLYISRPKGSVVPAYCTDAEEIRKEIESSYLDMTKKSYKKAYLGIGSCLAVGTYEMLLEDSKIYSSLIVLLEKAFANLDKFKKENSLYSFIDLSRFVIELFSDVNIANEEKTLYREILVDEFQDTNDIQAKLIESLQNSNVFFVGDIKQSIYGFRNANPKIMSDLLEKYSYDNTNGIGEKLIMNENYRCRKDVIESINWLFSTVMDFEHGGVDFVNDHHDLVAMNKDYIDVKEERLLDIVKYDSKNLAEHDENFDALSFEINYIAQDIKKKIDNHYQVQDCKIINDKKVFKLRDCTINDFAILMRKATKFEMVKRILEKNGLKVGVVANVPMNNNDIVRVITSLLKLIYLCNIDIEKSSQNMIKEFFKSYCAVARSFIFKKDDNDIFDFVSKHLIKNEKGRLQFVKSFKISEIEDDIIIEARKFASLINADSNIEIYNKVLEYFGIYNKLATIGETNVRLIIMEQIGKLIERNSGIGSSLFETALMVESSFKETLLKEASFSYKIDDSKSSAIKLMTVHMSKGLEYPIVYIPQTEYTCQSNSKCEVYYSKDIGFSMNKVCLSKEGMASLKNEVQKERSEEIRLFYVALTRAQEKAIVFAKDSKSPDSKDDIGNFNDCIQYALLNNPNSSKYNVIEIDEGIYDAMNIDYSYSKKLYKYKNYNVKPDYVQKPGFDKNGNKYKTGHKINIKTISHHVNSVLEDIDIENLQKGLEVHEILEYIDFSNPIFINVREDLKQYISNVLKNDLFKKITKAEIFREYEFVYMKDGIKENGIIDLLAIYDDHIDIIDYKYANIDHKYYDYQLNTYKKYIESLNLNKPINCYLVSITHNKIREVK